MKDINGFEILIGSIIVDSDNREYSIVEKDGEMCAKSLFNDCGVGEYILYQERIDRNGFRIIG